MNDTSSWVSVLIWSLLSIPILGSGIVAIDFGFDTQVLAVSASLSSLPANYAIDTPGPKVPPVDDAVMNDASQDNLTRPTQVPLSDLFQPETSTPASSKHLPTVTLTPTDISKITIDTTSQLTPTTSLEMTPGNIQLQGPFYVTATVTHSPGIVPIGNQPIYPTKYPVDETNTSVLPPPTQPSEPTYIDPTATEPIPAPTASLSPDQKAINTPLPATAPSTNTAVPSNSPLSTSVPLTKVPPTDILPTNLPPTSTLADTVTPTDKPNGTSEPTSVLPTSTLPVAVSPTVIPPMNMSPTTIPPTVVLPTTVLPTAILPTIELPTVILPTTELPTAVPPTTELPTAIPPTTVPSTSVPSTTASLPGQTHGENGAPTSTPEMTSTLTLPSLEEPSEISLPTTVVPTLLTSVAESPVLPISVPSAGAQAPSISVSRSEATSGTDTGIPTADPQPAPTPSSS